MKNELTIRVEISPAKAHAALIAAILAIFPASVGSETVTLQTYYPAPYGYFTQVRTSGQTTLAETSPGFVVIGATTQSSSEKLRVVGNARVEGTAYTTANLTVNAGGLNVNAGGANISGDTTINSGYVNVTAGNIHAGGLDTNLNNGSNYIHADRYSCSGMTANTACSGYATWTPGIYTHGNWYAPKTSLNSDYRSAGVGSDKNWHIKMMYWDGTSWIDQNVQTSSFLDDISINAFCCTF